MKPSYEQNGRYAVASFYGVIFSQAIQEMFSQTKIIFHEVKCVK